MNSFEFTGKMEDVLLFFPTDEIRMQEIVQIYMFTGKLISDTNRKSGVFGHWIPILVLMIFKLTVIHKVQINLNLSGIIYSRQDYAVLQNVYHVAFLNSSFYDFTIANQWTWEYFLISCKGLKRCSRFELWPMCCSTVVQWHYGFYDDRRADTYKWSLTGRRD